MGVRAPRPEAGSETQACLPGAPLGAYTPGFERKMKARVFSEEEGGRELEKEAS